jgi:hypothetical protein
VAGGGRALRGRGSQGFFGKITKGVFFKTARKVEFSLLCIETSRDFA